MNSHLLQNKIKAFLPKEAGEPNPYRNQLIRVLISANIEVVEDLNYLSATQCSIHIVGCSNTDAEVANAEFLFEQACKQNDADENFRIFVWQPPLDQKLHLSGNQASFINSIRNNHIQNLTFSNHYSAIMLVEDIRSIVYSEQKAVFDTNPADMFFIYNEIDEDSGKGIVGILDDIIKIETLNISLSVPRNYSELIAQQIQNSKLTIIYFNRTANWALPFAKQVWKNIGGASANKKILMVGDAEYEQNKNIAFDAPNVSNINASTDLIPLETKVFYDKMFA